MKKLPLEILNALIAIPSGVNDVVHAATPNINLWVIFAYEKDVLRILKQNKIASWDHWVMEDCIHLSVHEKHKEKVESIFRDFIVKKWVVIN